MLEYERQHWQAGYMLLAGVDEAGRGPLAGPVVAGAVAVPRDCLENESRAALSGLTDSKKLTERRREAFFEVLQNHPEIMTGVGQASVEEIDDLNILRATHVAMARAVSALPVPPDHVLVDGRPVQGLPCSSTAIVGGDGVSLLIAAASVVAKVTRDRQMVELDRLYPEYGLAKHKGYGSQAHMQALFEHGPTPIHRRSFRPVREAAAIKRSA
ncbi:MAG: ribonuclease HII [Kiritimatiellia bacterium]|jgi:ribonuclease HII|nr:ribonuclease HII [Kiritimatiellia bacterium]MDP6631564.1 ribonuclease HII [Kiritimatiellia bacterium]MDP6810670.1 ribonuclease HII [Kiritimatiellia bacterium]MDP7023756.1 ribonuclease HII [Kiritimatiellia bacterium]